MCLRHWNVYGALVSSLGILVSVGCGLQGHPVSSTTPISGTTPQIASVHLSVTPLVIRSGSSFQYQLVAEYSDGSTSSPTADVAWATDPTIASVSSGLLSCNNPGSTTLTSTFLGMTTDATFTCVLGSIAPKPGFVESAQTFDGPFASWENLKTIFGAKGDGVTDDTSAIQAALDSLSSHPAVLWIPRGTYIITRPLTVTGLSDITILGEDPLNTSISWAGSQGGTMLTLSGCTSFNIGRLTWDGRGATGVDIEVTWDDVSNFYPTRNYIHDSRIINTETGIHTGWAGETTVARVHFDHNTVAGLSLGDWNALNWNVLDCLFTDDAIGVTNWYGAGAFNVSNSVFVRSTVADIKMGNTGPFSIRSNLSMDSMTFFLTGDTGAPANIIIQGNTIVNPGSTPIATGTPGSLLVFDNQFLGLNPNFNILYSFCNSPATFMSVGNTYSVSQPFGGNIGQYTSVDEAASTADLSVQVSVPTEIYVPPFSNRQVFDLFAGASGTAMQAAIDAASAVGGVVHLSEGSYNVTQPLEISQQASVGILGDGALTTLVVPSTFQGPVIESYGKTVQLEDFRFDSYSPLSTDIQLHVPDVPSTRIFCDECTVNNQALGVEVDGLDDATVEDEVTTFDTAGWAQAIHGGAARQNAVESLGRVGEFMTSSSAYQVDLGGHLLIGDGWHDSGQGATQFLLTGSGSVTHQGGTIYTSSNPAMSVSGFKGNLTLLGTMTNSYISIPAGSPLTLFMGGVVDTGETSPFINLAPGASITEISSSLSPNYSVPSPLPDTSVTPAGIEHMLSMARTQTLSPRKPIVFDLSTVRMARLLLDNGGVGIRVMDSIADRAVGSYRITAANGASAQAQANCGLGEMSVAGIWTLQDGGDGFVGLLTAGAVLSEGLSPQLDGDGIVMVTAMSSARDRWQFEQAGDGSVTIVNRATGNLLTQTPSGCAYAAPVSRSANQAWLLEGTS